MSFEKNESAIATLVTTVAAVISLIYNVTHDAVAAVRISAVIIISISGAFFVAWVVAPEALNAWPEAVAAPHATACLLFIIIGMGKWVLAGRIKRNMERISVLEEAIQRKK